MHHYKQLVVWQQSIELATFVYKITKDFPSEERFGLISQIRRCAVSVGSNIAEGAGRNSNGEFMQFLGIASGSLNELETQLIISFKLLFIDKATFQFAIDKIIEIQNKIFKLKESIKNRK